jgi:hypothetical protein
MTNKRVYNCSNKTVATCGARIACPSGAHEFTTGFSEVSVAQSFVLCCCFVHYLLAILLSVLLLIVPLVSSNPSCNINDLTELLLKVALRHHNFNTNPANIVITA